MKKSIDEISPIHTSRIASLNGPAVGLNEEETIYAEFFFQRRVKINKLLTIKKKNNKIKIQMNSEQIDKKYHKFIIRRKL